MIYWKLNSYVGYTIQNNNKTNAVRTVRFALRVGYTIQNNNKTNRCEDKHYRNHPKLAY